MSGVAIDYAELARALIREGLPQAIAAQMASAQPERLYTKNELAVHLGVKEAQVDRFVRRGMPRETVGASPRFRLAAVEPWLTKNGRSRGRVGARLQPVPSVPMGGYPAGVTPMGAARRG